jgi:hypothetical protein
MTINEVISAVDALYPNTLPLPQKVQYLSKLDHLIASDITKQEFKGYTEDNGDTELIVGEPYTDIYVFWLQGWIDYWNQEYDKYNSAMMMYQSVFDAFAKDYSSKHRGGTVQFKFY